MTYSPHQTTGIKFKFSVNTQGIDKTWDYEKLASQFKDVEGTIEDVARHVRAGHALCAGVLNGQRRAKHNVIGSHWVLIDIDNSDVLRDEAGEPIKEQDGSTTKVYKHDLSLDEAIADPFIQKHCALVYTTASHKPDWHKFRLVFLLPEFVEGADAVEACVKFLMAQFPHDPSCKDCSRVFFGSTKAEFPLIHNVTLPIKWVQDAREMAEQERIQRAQRLEQANREREQFKKLSQDAGWNLDDLIHQALNFIPPRSPGSGNYDECCKILMALVDHFGPSEAEIIGERWSPSLKGTSWNIGHKIRSFKRGGITCATIFHFAKQYGFRFPVSNIFIEERDLQKMPNNFSQTDARTEDNVAGKTISPDERLRLALLDLSQEKDKIARTRKRSQICSHYRISKAEVEELVEETERKSSRPALKRMSLSELLNHETQELSWLIPELLPKGELVILGGAPKAGKTLMAIDAAYAIATGEADFLGMRCHRGKVLFVSNDASARSTKSQLIRRGFRESDTDWLDVIFDWTIDKLYELEQTLADFRPDLVIIDSLKSISVGSVISENSAEFANNIYTLRNLFSQYHTAGILIHHTSKNADALGVGKLRGSSAIAGASWGSWLLEAIPKPDPNNSKKMIIDPADPKRMFSAFVREGEGQLIAAEFNPEDNSYQRTDIEVVNEQNSIADRILSVLRLNPGGLSGRSIIECLGMSPDEGRGVYTSLTRMEAKLLISTIKSPSDKRVTFYTIKNTQHPEKNTQQNTQQEGDSPSPPHPVSNVEYCSESHKEKDLQDTQQKNQNTQQHTENTQQHLDTSSTDEDLNLLLDIDPSILLNNFQAGGGRESPPEVLNICTESPKAQPKMETNNSGWKNCSIKNLKVDDRISCFPTLWHFEKPKPVTAKVTALESQGGFLMEIKIEYTTGKNGESQQVDGHISGGSISDWVLGIAERSHR